jgi:DHA3 family macrolide efflux protein-like MFS transporter
MRRDVWILMCGQLVSIVGDGVAAVAVLWWVLEATGSVALMASVAAVTAAVGVTASPFAGVVVDRLDRRRVMIAADIVRASCYGALALVAAGGRLPLWAVFSLLSAARLAGSLFSPALGASLPRMVGSDELQQVNGAYSLAQGGGQILGMALGGVLVASAGAAAALGADALSFVASFATLALVAIPAVARTSGGRPTFGGDLRAGLDYLRTDTAVRSLAIVALMINGFGSAVGVLFPVLARDRFHAGAQGYGFLEAAVSVGLVVGSALLSALRVPMRRAWALYGPLILLGALVAGLGLVRSIDVAIGLTAVVGMLLAALNVFFNTCMQRRIPADMQGRVFSMVGGVGMALTPVTQSVAGVLAAVFSAGSVVVASGALMVTSALGLGAASASRIDAAVAEQAS